MNGCLLLSLIVCLLIDVVVRDGLIGRLDVYAFCPSKAVATYRTGMSGRDVQGSHLVLFLCIFVILAALSSSIKCLFAL